MSKIKSFFLHLILGPELKERVDHSWIFFILLFSTIALVPWMFIFYSNLQWLKNTVLTLLLLIFTASFGLIWPLVRRGSRNVSLVLGIIAVESLACTLSFPGAWHWAGLAALFCAVLLFIQTAVPAFARPGMEKSDWVIWWTAIFGVALPTVIDTLLWSWLAMGLAFAESFWNSEPAERNPLYHGLGILIFTLILSSWIPGTETSLIRDRLPAFNLRNMIHLNGLVFLAVSVSAAGFLFWKRCRVIPETSPRQRIFLFMLGFCPLIIADVAARWFGTQAALFTWAAILLSSYLAFNLSFLEEDRGIFLSLMALAFFRSLSNEIEFAFLILVSLAGWILSSTRGGTNPLRQGLVLNGLFLWSYMVTSGSLNFSQISMQERMHVFGLEGFPRALDALLILKQTAIVAASAMPLLSDLPFRGLMAALLPMGALSAGCLSLLWLDQTVDQSGSGLLINDRVFEKAIFVVLLACVLVALWIFARVAKVGFKTAVVYEIT